MHYDILQILKKISQKSDVNMKHSAAILKDNKILQVSFNKHSINSTIHAEINAIKDFKQLKKPLFCDILVTQIKN